MINFSEVEQVLEKSFQDYILSTEEKAEIQKVIADYDRADQLNFARNVAFKIARVSVSNQSSLYLRALKWLEQVIKTIDGVRQESGGSSPTEVFFSPGNRIVNRITGLLDTAQQKIDVCVFTISDNGLRDALLSSHQRGTKIRIITDNHKTFDLGSDINELASAGIEVRTDKHDSHMHHKFAIIDNSTLINGSFNWTRSATKENQENIIVDAQPHLVKAFALQFEKLWRESEPLSEN